ncbi:hypothetical protein [Sphingomonas hankookensis]
MPPGVAITEVHVPQAGLRHAVDFVSIGEGDKERIMPPRLDSCRYDRTADDHSWRDLGDVPAVPHVTPRRQVNSRLTYPLIILSHRGAYYRRKPALQKARAATRICVWLSLRCAEIVLRLMESHLRQAFA